MKFFVYIACSLDGFIARKDGDIEWLHEIPNPQKLDFGYNTFMSKIDAMVIGRKSYEKVLSFDEWPYAVPVFVLSNTLQTTPMHIEAVLHGEPEEIASKLEEYGYSNIYLDGGVAIQGFLTKRMVDEMIITRVPIILGDGIPLFATMNIEQSIWLDHIETKAFYNGLVQSRYGIKE